MNAREGDKLTIGGPRGSLVVPEDYAYQVYVCDESGMPALRRRLESLSRLAVRPNVTALVSVQDAAYQDYLPISTSLLFSGLSAMTNRW
jgi:ferric-chelate reductase (NADPH)